jgi:hypothetical protein
MRILITGGTGLIGQALCRHWRAQGHELWVLSRSPGTVATLCGGARGIARLDDLPAGLPVDAVVNLAGAPIADARWSATRRALLWQSRVDLTRELVHWMGRQTPPPRTLLSASATGWYGDRADEALDENSPARATDFGARLCMAWENEAARARQWGTRVAILRIAPVLARQGGMLPRLLRPFRLGLGGPLGPGSQWMPWIHIDDLVALADFVLRRATCNGVCNACAPESVRNRDFTQALARALHRPAVLAVPAWALRLALGEMSVLLLGGQRLLPRRALQCGFPWRHPTLATALQDLLQPSSPPPATGP